MHSCLPFFLLLVVLSSAGSTQYKKVIPNINPEAKCLDGSPSFLYVNEGSDPNNYLIYFLGGGACGGFNLETTLESCYQRSKTYLGSETMWPDILPQSAVEGYLSTNPQESKYANWTKFFIPYCDGALHQGYVANPVMYKNNSLYFRGALNTKSSLSWIIKNYNLIGAEKIIFTGMSAGAMAVNMWINYFTELIGNASKIYAISDSSIFINFDSYQGEMILQTGLQNLYKVANVDEQTPATACNDRYVGEEWKCYLLQYLYPFIKSRFLIINSEYDAYNIPHFLNISCLTEGVSGYTLKDCSHSELAYIQKYRVVYLQLLYHFLMVNDQLSIWTIACSQHVYAAYGNFYNSSYQMIPAKTGLTVADVIDDFVLQNQRKVIFSREGWPYNTGCAW